MKKAVTSVIILAIFATAVFLIGWVQIAVPAGKYGVLLSKTGGVNPAPIVPGEFRWSWERLLPTNATILVFDLTPIAKQFHCEGSLPSGAIYAKMLEGTPDFSWKATVSVTGRVTPSKLADLVKHNGIRDQKALDAWIDAQLSVAAENAAQAAIQSMKTASPSEAPNAKEQDANFGLEVIEVKPTFIVKPDLSLYEIAANAYADYQNRRRELIAKTAARESDAATAEYLQMERLERWGEILTKYPILIDYLAVTRDDAGAAFNAVRNLRKTAQ